MNAAADGLRRAKHAAWLRRRRWESEHEALADSIHTTLSRAFPPAPAAVAAAGRARHEVPQRIFVLWTGDNSMSAARRRSMEVIRESQEPDIEVVLVTSQNLHDWVVPDWPLHPAYSFLSLIHRSDYLRAYLMHHHGGGYTDVKEPTASWLPTFELIRGRDDIWVAGYRELSHAVVAPVPGPVGNRLRRHFRFLVGNCAYIARPRTPFSEEWLRAAEAVLDRHYEALSQVEPSVYGESVGYPLRYYELLGEQFHPLCLRWRTHLEYDDRLRPRLTDYK